MSAIFTEVRCQVIRELLLNSQPVAVSCSLRRLRHGNPPSPPFIKGGTLLSPFSKRGGTPTFILASPFFKGGLRGILLNEQVCRYLLDNQMTVVDLAHKLNLWTKITTAVAAALPVAEADKLLSRLAALPVRPSRATRSLGAYVSKAGEPVCIRLQFAQEPGNLRETFLHELSHCCDHLCHQTGQRYRRAHGPHWRFWAKLLGAAPQRCGKSAALEKLYQQRLKLVAVCQNCGAEFRRTRCLNRRRKYFHSTCGGRLRPVRVRISGVGQ